MRVPPASRLALPSAGPIRCPTQQFGHRCAFIQKEADEALWLGQVHRRFKSVERLRQIPASQVEYSAQDLDGDHPALLTAGLRKPKQAIERLLRHFAGIAVFRERGGKKVKVRISLQGCFVQRSLRSRPRPSIKQDKKQGGGSGTRQV